MKGQIEVIAIVAIIAAIIVLGLVFGGFTNPFTVPTGFTTLSLSNIQFTSSSSAFTGQQWIMTVVQGGLGQSATGTVTANKISTDSGEDADRNFNIAIAYSEQSCNYQIRKTSGAAVIAVGKVEYFGLLCDEAAAKANCGINVIAKGAYFGEATCWCIYPVLQTAAVSENDINNPYIRTKSTVTVSNGEETSSVIVDTQGDSFHTINENVKVTYNGDLLKSNCPSQAPIYAFYRDGAGWTIGSKTRYDNYKNIASSFEIDAVSVGGSRNNLDFLINNLNNAASAAMTPESFGIIEQQTQLDGATIVNMMDTLVSAPTYTFFVKADYLKVNQPVPNIYINRVTSNAFQTSGYIRVELTNTGDQGNTRVWATCPSPFSNSPQKEVGVSPGTTEVVYLPITANTQVAATEVCTVTSDDYHHQRTATVVVRADPEMVCEANKKECTADNKIRQCNEYGSGFSILEVCEDTEQCALDALGNPECREKGQGADMAVNPLSIEFILIYIIIFIILVTVGAGIGGEIGAVLFAILALILIYLLILAIPGIALWISGLTSGIGGLFV